MAEIVADRLALCQGTLSDAMMPEVAGHEGGLSQEGGVDAGDRREREEKDDSRHLFLSSFKSPSESEVDTGMRGESEEENSARCSKYFDKTIESESRSYERL